MLPRKESTLRSAFFTPILSSAFFTRSLRAYFFAYFFTRILLTHCARFLLRPATAFFTARVLNAFFKTCFPFLVIGSCRTTGMVNLAHSGGRWVTPPPRGNPKHTGKKNAKCGQNRGPRLSSFLAFLLPVLRIKTTHQVFYVKSAPIYLRHPSRLHVIVRFPGPFAH